MFLMLIRKLALAGAFFTYGMPALAQSDFSEFRAKPRPITTLAVQKQKVEVYAVTARARADTAMRKDYHRECKSMAKVAPGYPQPAFVSLDLRIRF